MYGLDDIGLLIPIAGKLHFSTDDKITRCGVPLIGTDWEIKREAQRSTIRDALVISREHGLMHRFGSKGRDLSDYCPHCIEALSETKPHWKDVLHYPWENKSQGLPGFEYAKELLIVKVPRDHLVGWITVQTEPKEYTYQTGKGVAKTNPMPSRTYHTPMVFGSISNAPLVSQFLLDLKSKADVENKTADLELHRSEDIFFLCSKDSQWGQIRFSNFISFTPPLEGVKVEIIAQSDLDKWFVEIKPLLEPLGEVHEDDS